MAIKDDIAAAFKQARKDRDDKTKTVIGMLKAKLTNELKAGGDAEENDELWLKVLGAYAKELRKSIAAYDELGDKGAEPKAEAEWELAFCDKFLPSKLDEAATKALVAKLAADNGITEKKQMGRLMGLIMKGHKDEVDGDLARKAAEEVLS